MELPPRAITLLVLLLLSPLVLSITATTTAVAGGGTVAPAPSPKPAQLPTSFLRARCATTLYPAICCGSLLPYAAAFQTSRVRLAHAAADVAAARLRGLFARLDDLRRQLGPDVTGGPRGTAALEDCASTVSAAADQARRSSTGLRRLDDEEGSASTSAAAVARWAVSNARTWLSAVISDVGTCADGFADAGETAMGSPAGKLAGAGVASARRYASNALALVNGIPL